MGPGGKINTLGKAWEERLADDVVSFNPAGLCCWADHNTGVAGCKLACTAGVTRTLCGRVTWKTDEWHVLCPVTAGLPKAPLPSHSSTQHLSHVLQGKVRCFPGRARQNSIFSFLNL